MPVLYLGRNVNHISRVQFLSGFAPLLIITPTRRTKKNLTAVMVDSFSLLYRSCSFCLPARERPMALAMRPLISLNVSRISVRAAGISSLGSCP